DFQDAALERLDRDGRSIGSQVWSVKTFPPARSAGNQTLALATRSVASATIRASCHGGSVEMRLLIALGLVLAYGATMRSATEPSLSEAGRRSLSAFLEAAVARGEVPGVVAMVVGRDRIIYEGAFGKRDVGRNADMSTDTIFRIASMTKPLTTAAILMLADEGRLKV